MTALFVPGVCRGCGCTDDAACVVDGSNNLVDVVDGNTLEEGTTTCHWVEPDLCSACIEGPAPALLFDAGGRPLRGTP